MLQLMPAPPPPPEYCLFWAHHWWPWGEPWWLCMQKGEWSGWAQFIGAMLAIGVAISLPLLSERRTRARDFHWAQATLTGLGLAFEECRDACIAGSRANFNAGRVQLQRAIDDCSALQFSSLTHEEWGGIVGLRNIATGSISVTDELTDGADWGHLCELFEAGAHGVGVVGRLRFKMN